MFGYIKIHKSELKIKEYEQYKGLYCSLCKQLGKDFGFFARFTLNYDFTFLLLIRLALSEKECSFLNSHCSFNPRKKCFCIEKDNDELKLSSAISIMVLYHKLRDNINDEGILKKIPIIFSYLFFKMKYKKAKKCYPDIAKFLENEMIRQKKIEKSDEVNIDLCADPSAKSLGYIFSYNVSEDKKEKIYSFGYSLGRLIYFLDAVEDYEDDLKKGKFNPFVKNREKYGDCLKESMSRILNVTADENAKIYENLGITRFKNIIDNIIFYGFEDSINILLKNKEKEKWIRMRFWDWTPEQIFNK